MGNRGKQFNAEQVDEMVDMYTVQFKSMNDIATKFSCTGPTIKKALVGAGVTIRPKGRRPSVRAPKATPEATEPSPFQREIYQRVE